MKIKLETGSNARDLTKAAAKPSKTGGTTRNASLTKCSQPQRQKSGAAVPVVVVVVVTAAITVLPSRAFPQSTPTAKFFVQMSLYGAIEKNLIITPFNARHNFSLKFKYTSRLLNC